MIIMTIMIVMITIMQTILMITIVIIIIIILIMMIIMTIMMYPSPLLRGAPRAPTSAASPAAALGEGRTGSLSLYIFIYLYTYVYTHVCISLSLSLYIYIYIHIDMYVCMYVCMNAYIYIYIYIYIYTSIRFGKGQMGSALAGSLRIFFFSFRQRDFLDTDPSKSVNICKFRVPLPQSVKTHCFCGGTIRVDPICPQPIYLI